MSAPPPPYKLVTVNTSPERAVGLVRKLAAEVSDSYTIKHCGNAASMFKPVKEMKLKLLTPLLGIEDVELLVLEHTPDILVRLRILTYFRRLISPKVLCLHVVTGSK